MRAFIGAHGRATLLSGSLLLGVVAIALLANTGKTTAPTLQAIKPVGLPSSPPAMSAAPPAPAKPKPAVLTATPGGAPTTLPTPTVAQMIGQEVMVRMTGLYPDAELLARIRHGQVGGVILYGENISTSSQVHALVAMLQHAATVGHDPRLLISTDQEGGQVRRLPWVGPSVSQQQMGADGASTSMAEGEETGRGLRADGVNVNLAPVLDVARSSSDFIWQEGRGFGMSAAVVANSAVPFARGLQRERVAATAKHFPGDGGALIDTDNEMQKIDADASDLTPYRYAIAAGVAMIMVTTAVYPNLDPSGLPAALSPTIITGLLRKQMGYQGLIITDDLQRPTGYSTATAAVLAAQAGANIILVLTSEGGGVTAYKAMLAAARSGRIPSGTVANSYDQVLNLKQQLDGSA